MTGSSMNDTGEAASELTPLQDEAHAWIRRLVSGEATSADAEALQRWCSESPAHAAAFSEASQFWTAFGSAGQSLLNDEAAAAGRSEGSVTRRRTIGRRAFIGGALAASAAGLFVTRPPFGLWPSWSELAADYRTGAGEQRQVVTNNGVTIQMNTRTSISLHADGNSGSVELIAGEASFATAARESQPISVIAAGGRASAQSGRFDVRRFDSGACVTCVADAVRVDFQGGTATLGPRQRVTYDADGFGEIVSVDPATVVAWQNGLLIFNMTPLAEVIEELNRYRTGRIILLNRSVAENPVNGRFRIDQPEEALLQIERAFGVKGRALPGGFILLS